MNTARSQSIIAVVTSVILFGCAKSAPGVASLLVVDARIVTGAIDTLRISADLTNGTDTDFARIGCLRPALALDSLAGTQWVPLGVLQPEELIQCVRTFTVKAGTTQRFDAQFTRAVATQKFPRGTPLRVRVISPPAELEPFFSFTLVP